MIHSPSKSDFYNSIFRRNPRRNSYSDKMVVAKKAQPKKKVTTKKTNIVKTKAAIKKRKPSVLMPAPKKTAPKKPVAKKVDRTTSFSLAHADLLSIYEQDNERRKSDKISKDEKENMGPSDYSLRSHKRKSSSDSDEDDFRVNKKMKPEQATTSKQPLAPLRKAHRHLKNTTTSSLDGDTTTDEEPPKKTGSSKSSRSSPSYSLPSICSSDDIQEPMKSSTPLSKSSESDGENMKQDDEGGISHGHGPRNIPSQKILNFALDQMRSVATIAEMAVLDVEQEISKYRDVPAVEVEDKATDTDDLETKLEKEKPSEVDMDVDKMRSVVAIIEEVAVGSLGDFDVVPAVAVEDKATGVEMEKLVETNMEKEKTSEVDDWVSHRRRRRQLGVQLGVKRPSSCPPADTSDPPTPDPFEFNESE